jgi:putative endonuclease
MYYLYVVRCADDTLYTGITTDVARRLDEHNHSALGARYTRGRRPVRLVWQESHPSRSAASQAEAAFKRLTRKQKQEFLVAQKS